MPVNNQLAEIPLGETNSAFTFDRMVGILNYLVEQALLLGGVVAIAAIVYYGLRMSLSRGEPKAFSDAKSALIKAIIGAALIAGVYTIIYTVQGTTDVIRN